MAPITQLSEFQAGMLETLQAGGSVKVTPRPGQEGLAAEARAAMGQLVDAGLARVSRTGRYWGTQAAQARGPATQARVV